MNADTGEIVFEQNADEEITPASTIKILSALLILEAVDRGELSLTDTVTVTNYMINAVPSDASTMWVPIEAGEILSIEQLLYAHMLSSDCRASYILAYVLDGNIPAFSRHMNERAKELGCTNSNFTNPAGYPERAMHTTARDLLLITEECMKNETFRIICGTAEYTLKETNIKADRTLYNTNRLITKTVTSWTGAEAENEYYYEYATGIKTGTSTPSKNCLISSVDNGAHSFLFVVMGAPDGSYNDRGVVVLPQYADTIRMAETLFAFHAEQDALKAEAEAKAAAEAAFKNELTLKLTSRVRATESCRKAFQEIRSAVHDRDAELQVLVDQALYIEEHVNDRVPYATVICAILIILVIPAGIVSAVRKHRKKKNSQQLPE